MEYRARVTPRIQHIASPLVIAFLQLARSPGASGADTTPQDVEGFDKVEFHHNAGGGGAGTRDFRGTARGYMTAGWWAPGQVKENYVSWKTAAVPEKRAATFHFVGASSVLPS